MIFAVPRAWAGVHGQWVVRRAGPLDRDQPRPVTAGAGMARVLGPGHPDTLATRRNIAYWTGQAEEPPLS